jgi:hypothetical protein
MLSVLDTRRGARLMVIASLDQAGNVVVVTLEQLH